MGETMYDYIFQQPDALKRVFAHRKEDAAVFVRLFRENRPDRIYLIGSGSSLNAARAAAPAMEELLKIEVTPAASSAIPFIRGKAPFLIFISQGGNSANTVAAIKAHSNYPHLAVTGTESCSVNDISDHVLIRCGEEKAGPKTKGYVSTFFLLYCISLEAAGELGLISEQEYCRKAMEAEAAVGRMEEDIRKAAEWFERNKEEMKQELKWFKDQGIQLKVLDLPTTMIQLEEGQEWIREMVNNILIEVLSSIAQEEPHTIRKRQREGIDAAKQAGVRFGAPDKGFPEEWESYYARYRKGELTRKYVLEKLGLSVDRFKYLKKKYERAVKGE